MIGGIILLGIVGLAADMLTRFGLDVLLVAIYKERRAKGETVETLLGEIDWLPLSKDLKLKLRDAIAP
jgi:hypothetical protein